MLDFWSLPGIAHKSLFMRCAICFFTFALCWQQCEMQTGCVWNAYWFQIVWESLLQLVHKRLWVHTITIYIHVYISIKSHIIFHTAVYNILRRIIWHYYSILHFVLVACAFLRLVICKLMCISWGPLTNNHAVLCVTSAELLINCVSLADNMLSRSAHVFLWWASCNYPEIVPDVGAMYVVVVAAWPDPLLRAAFTLTSRSFLRCRLSAICTCGF